MTDLVGGLARIRKRLSQNAYVNEAAVSTQIVRPILQGLGWDVDDPEQVCSEYPLKVGSSMLKVDLALRPLGEHPQCFIEVKSTKKQLRQIGQSDPDRQLFEYSFHAGVPLGLLTNGGKWHFYSMYGTGPYANRRVRELNIETDSLEEVAAALNRYLSFGNTRNGSAADFAREDLKQRINQSKARKELPHAWASLVKGDLNDELATLLIEATKSLLDGKGTPTKRDVAGFLRSLKPDPSGSALEWEPPGETQPLGPSEPVISDPEPNLGVGVRYWVLSQERTARSGRTAYVDVFQILARRDRAFLARFSEVTRGRRSRQVSRTKRELSSSEAILRRAAELQGGWWLNTNLSHRDQEKYLKTACEVAGIRFGDKAGLRISFKKA